MRDGRSEVGGRGSEVGQRICGDAETRGHGAMGRLMRAIANRKLTTLLTSGPAGLPVY
jgi:hypothetical protein